MCGYMVITCVGYIAVSTAYVYMQLHSVTQPSEWRSVFIRRTKGEVRYIAFVCVALLREDAEHKSVQLSSIAHLY